jgi:activator of HSP90 ATPase
MADVLHQVGVNSSSKELYEILTTEEGLQSWWSQHSDIDGAKVTVSFYNGMVTFVLNVAESVPGEKVVWEVEGGPPDWADTTITWTISEHEGQTMLHLAHSGFASTAGNFAAVNYNWGWYVTSIKFLLEKGEGMPHTDADLPG